MTRGEIWWADFGIPFGSEPGYKRPVLIVQEDDFNRSNLRTVVIVPFSTNLELAEVPGNVYLEKKQTSLSKDSVIVISQIYAVDKRIVRDVEAGLMLVLGM